MKGNWAGTGSMLKHLSGKELWERSIDKAIQKEAHRLRGIMVESFNNGGPPGQRWPRLSTFTQLVSRALGKGDRKPLMDSGDLRNSHSVTKEGDVWFVGINRKARSKKRKGQQSASSSSLVNIALIHEFGAGPFTVRVTSKMRGFFFFLNRATKGQIKPLHPSTTRLVIRIPKRAWVGPIWDQEKDNSERNIKRDSLNGIGASVLSNLL
jgi:hypothetical protein